MLPLKTTCFMAEERHNSGCGIPGIITCTVCGL